MFIMLGPKPVQGDRLVAGHGGDHVPVIPGWDIGAKLPDKDDRGHGHYKPERPNEAGSGSSQNSKRFHGRVYCRFVHAIHLERRMRKILTKKLENMV